MKVLTPQVPNPTDAMWSIEVVADGWGRLGCGWVFIGDEKFLSDGFFCRFLVVRGG